jgi:hypothetical protein
MSTTYKISQLRDLFNDWETGLDQAVTLLPLFPIEVINEYWSMGWMQNPGNPDDRWKSDWIRAVLIAFSSEGSLPNEAKKQERIRHRKEKSYYDSTDKFGLLTLTSDWNHLSSQLLHDLINNLGVTQLDFKCTELFENYLKNPAEVTEIKVYISKEWNDTTTKIKDTDLAKTISERIPRNIEILSLSIEDNYTINFIENSFFGFKKLKSFTFESNTNNGVLDFSTNTLLEQITIKLRNKKDTLSIRGLNNCLLLNNLNISCKAKGNINLEPIEISKLINLACLNISNTIHLGDINGKIKNEFTFNNYYYDGDGVEGIKHIDVELCQSIDSYTNQVELNAVLDLETLKIKGDAKDVEIKVLPKLVDFNLDLIGEGRSIVIDFMRELNSKPTISSNKLTLLSLTNYKNRELPCITVNAIGERPNRHFYDEVYNERKEKRLFIKIDKSSLESLDGLENIKCDTVLILNANNELKKLFKEPNIRCEQVKKLLITNSTITNLEGINQFPNLTELFLNDLNCLENINGLESLTQLKTIDLTNCSLINSLEPLVNLSSITDMKLSGCVALKPKPKRLNLSGMQVFDELNRHNKSKPKKKETASAVSISKIIEFFNSADVDSINQGFMLLSMCNPEELNRLYNSAEYSEIYGKLVFNYLPKAILEDENNARLISLLLLFEAPDESLAGQYRNKIEALFLNCDEEVKKPKISLGSVNNIDFTPYINSIGKFSKFKNLKQIQIEEFASLDFIDMAEVPSIVDIHISNIKEILNFDSMAINKNLIKLTIQEQYYVGQSAANATQLIDVVFSSNFASLEYLKLNLNCNSITGLEHLVNCNDLRLIIHAGLNRLTLNSSMKKLEYIYLKGWFYSIDNIEQLQKLTELDLTQAFLHEPKFLIKLLSNEDFVLNNGILENTKLS